MSTIKCNQEEIEGLKLIIINYVLQYKKQPVRRKRLLVFDDKFFITSVRMNKREWANIKGCYTDEK